MSQFKILAPLDFSDTSPYVLEAAGHIAELFDGKITPFHSFVPVTNMYANDPFMLEGVAAPMMPDLDSEKQTRQGHLNGFSGKHVSEKWLDEPVIAIGDAVTTITEAANDYDFIVMGSHGRSGFSRIFMGSVSDKVLRTVHKPILIVNEEKQLKPIKNIMITTDFSEYSKKVFPFAENFAAKTQAASTLVHILSYDISDDKPDDKKISQQEDRLKDVAEKEFYATTKQQVETKLIVSSNNAHEAILDESLNGDYQLIIMAAVGHTGLEYLMMGSTTSHVVRHVQTPVISINPKVKQTIDEEE